MNLSRTFVVGLLATLLSACGGPDRPGASAGPDGTYQTYSGGPPGGVVVALLDGEPDDLNPVTYTSLPAHQAIRLMFRALARRDSTLSGYQPDLATSWEAEGDSVVVLKLRPDARWHDGRPVTAEDVVFTIDLQRNPETASQRQSDVAAVVSVMAVDSVTVRVRMRRTGAYAVNALLEVVPVPKHLLSGISPAQMKMAPFGRNPIGNGFFKFGRWEPQQLILEVNAEMPEGRAALDRIVMRVVPDITAALTDLLTGQADLLPRIPPDLRSRLESSESARLYQGVRVRPNWIAWNVSRPPLSEVAVRQAIMMAIDRVTLARGLFGDLGEPAYTALPPSVREHSADVRPLPFNPDSAGRLLDAAGWRDSNGDGIRDRRAVPLRIQVDYIASDQVRQDVLVAVQNMVKQIGVDLILQPYERTAWVERLRGRNFQGSSWGWGWGPGVVGPNAEAVFHSRSIPPNGANFAGYRNARVDQLIDSALVTRDTAQLRTIWREFEQIVTDEAPYAPLYLDPELFGVSSRVENVRFRGIEWWEDVPYWYIPAERLLPRDRVG